NRIPNNSNIVATFHAYGPPNIPNYSLSNTFVTDEFFGLMDPNEGRMQGSEGLGIAVGRMLVSNVLQANQMVAKVYNYKNAESYGRWRNEYIVVSDDIDASVDIGFVPTLERISQDLGQNRPFVNVRKIYSDAYVQQ